LLNYYFAHARGTYVMNDVGVLINKLTKMLSKEYRILTKDLTVEKRYGAKKIIQ